MIFRIFSSKKKKLQRDQKIKAKKIEIQEMLKQAGSFKSFCDYTEAFDMDKRAMVRRRDNLFKLYVHGIGINSPVLVVHKN